MNTTERIQNEIDVLLADRRSLLLATVDAAGAPHASYAPFIRDTDGSLLILVSGLACHTCHLTQSGIASVLAIEDEAEASQIYARRRLTLTCATCVIAREDAAWNGLVDRFEQRFGDLVSTLRGLADFILIRLMPHAAMYVKVFGQAWSLSGPDLGDIVHLHADPRS